MWTLLSFRSGNLIYCCSRHLQPRHALLLVSPIAALSSAVNFTYGPLFSGCWLITRLISTFADAIEVEGICLDNGHGDWATQNAWNNDRGPSWKVHKACWTSKLHLTRVQSLASHAFLQEGMTPQGAQNILYNWFEGHLQKPRKLCTSKIWHHMVWLNKQTIKRD